MASVILPITLIEIPLCGYRFESIEAIQESTQAILWIMVQTDNHNFFEDWENFGINVIGGRSSL